MVTVQTSNHMYIRTLLHPVTSGHQDHFSKLTRGNPDRLPFATVPGTGFRNAICTRSILHCAGFPNRIQSHRGPLKVYHGIPINDYLY